ncbi:hypothetical protein TSUD_304030 [Trifolium subterraneum]|uniref:ABC transporter domain-containing protein n=1 Tax=Trifolium subterraneum TaxID=3900 RepID=A0A2Z6M3W4_TRISU|nr:hypothetical protein TSUD_304030 [Trifolium subterraneum]
MKKQWCEIEAIGINYMIHSTQTTKQPFKIFNKPPKPEDEAKAEQWAGSGVKHVLKNVNFIAKPCEILAIVGPSGAGKSSLLEILAGRVSPQNGGSILVNQEHIDKSQFRKISGRRLSVGVEVIHDPKVLILDEATSGLDSTSALQIIDMLKGMAESRGRTIILSIHQPGFRIVKLFNSILLLANGRVLHHGTVDLLDVNLRLMGLELPLHVNVVEFAMESIETIQQQQQKCQQVQVEAQKQLLGTTMRLKKADDQGESRSGKFTLQQLFQQSKVFDIENMIVGMDFSCHHANSRLRETVILAHRFSKNIIRTKELFAFRTIQMLVSGLILGSIYGNLKDGIVGAEQRVGLFAFILTYLLSSTIEALPIFLQEREILMKEISSGSYRVSSYAIANGLVYLPFLLILAILFAVPLYWLIGLNQNFTAFLHFLLLIWLILYTANSVVVCFSALVPNFIVGNSVIAGVIGSSFLFSGYFISNHDIPKYWIFMHYLSLFKYPFEGFLINEFSNSKKCLEYMFGACVMRGEDILKEEGYGDTDAHRVSTSENHGDSQRGFTCLVLFCG